MLNAKNPVLPYIARLTRPGHGVYLCDTLGVWWTESGTTAPATYLNLLFWWNGNSPGGPLAFDCVNTVERLLKQQNVWQDEDITLERLSEPPEPDDRQVIY